MAYSPGAATEHGEVYFWREYGSEWSFLSQWYSSPFHAEDKDIVFQTAEQYMMYQKAILFNDPAIAAKILKTTSPKEQKALGRKVSNFDNDVWFANRERIVRDGSYYKFRNSLLTGEDLKAQLLKTGDKYLVEASPMDRIWGIGFGDKKAPDKREKWGLNLLGNALVHARDRIRSEEKAENAGRKSE